MIIAHYIDPHGKKTPVIPITKLGTFFYCEDYVTGNVVAIHQDCLIIPPHNDSTPHELHSPS